MPGNRSNQSPLPLSFPVKGKEFRALATVGFYNSPVSKPIFKGEREGKGSYIFDYKLRALRVFRGGIRFLVATPRQVLQRLACC